ncbi:multidrug ABC transporter permease/ATPase [Nitzschia inconspicua]|uniref:Multidrug ABC transporter permease/ATPase n=1 Tax=Nitzschia inconspicua TaxID=303405 RepID=A0A9K3PY41_9STRA|nr:multidrug ABC transporter permease/ATPase [Nitzschia inconspicua]
MNKVQETHSGPSTAGTKDPEEQTPLYKGVPEEDAWFLSKLFFMWLRPLFRRAAELHKEGKGIEFEDLVPLISIDESRNVGAKFEEVWKKQVELEKLLQKQDSTAKTDADAPLEGKKTINDLKNSKEYGTTKLRKTLLAVMGWRFVFAGFVKAVNTILQFSFPLLLNAILSFIEDTQAGKFTEDDPWYDRYRGYWLSALLFVVMTSKAITETRYFHMVNRSGWEAKSAVSVAVYNKSLRMSSAERASTTLGEIVNLMQVDASKIELFIPQVHVLWDGAFQIIGYMTILYTLIGWPCFAGLIIMIFAGPVQGIVMKKLFGMTREIVKYTDARVESTNEALQGIQNVKIQTWEDQFLESITKQRAEELKYLKSSSYLRGFSRAYMGALPGIVAVTSFVVYALAFSGAEISASLLFSALVAFEQLRFPLLFYPMALAQLVQAQVSASRVEVFLDLDEIGTNDSIGDGEYHRNPDAEGSIVIKDAEVYWRNPRIAIDLPDADVDVSDDTSTSPSSKSLAESSDTESASAGEALQKAVLRNINMKVEQGELCAIVGRVASGKSTLCSAILNETFLERGSITLNGSVAYAAQTPWILNATVRENILFGLPFDEVKYNKVIMACQLKHDLSILTDGDETEIGERGINLSGGQKARISVARAAYSSLCHSDVVVLDDPLSALDPEVAKKLFHECIVELMRGKTRVLVTNQIPFLTHCDTVVALKKGEILEQGKTTDLLADSSSEVSRLLKRSSSGKSSKKAEKSEDKGEKEQSMIPEAETQTKNLVSKEERNVGAVSLSVYLKYLKAGGGYCMFVCVYFFFILSAANSLTTNSWISFWTSDASYENHSQAFYLGFYALFAVTLGIFTFFRAFFLAQFGVRASETLHRNLLDSILRAPQSFFDTTPLGRIISRFSKDLYSIDLELVDYFDFFLFTTLNVAVALGTILFVTPWFGVAVIPLGFFYFRFLNYFRDVSRETKRLDSITRSPVYAFFSETLGGLETIRAYGKPDRFRLDFSEKIDANTRANYNNKTSERWLSVRLETIGSIISGLAAIFASITAINGTDRQNFASLAGLSLTFAIQITSMLNWCVRSFATLEAGMNSVERVIYYTENIPHEAPATRKGLEVEAKETKDPSPSNPSVFAVSANGGKAENITDDWPQHGGITLKSLKMRYRPDTPLVLKGLDVSIQGGQRVGVVGRTGSGKSSLLLTLLRLVEPTLDVQNMEDYVAPMTIDGIDVLRVGLKDLRSRMGIIPQNPVLFSGTIRSNIDPFGQFSNDQIWKALEQCGLKAAVEAMPGQLDAVVSEYGQNLSSGTRQMLVLGRALLRQCRILLLDEATSSVDLETDSEIQRTLREAFANCTVLTIAHRINTIMDSDKILVMKDGVAVEFASPKELLDDKNSLFSEIVRHAEAEEHE